MLIFSGYSIRINYNIKYKENKEQSVNLFFWEPLKTSLTANFLQLCTSSALAKLEIHSECIP